MKNIICYLLFSFPLLAFGQINDNFSDGDFNNNPQWYGDVDSFEVSNDALHLNAPPNSSESFLLTASNGSVGGFWEFFVQLDFNPSSSNKAWVYLMSDTSLLQEDIHGYFVEIGGSADRISLYRQDGNTTSLLLESVADVINKSVVAVKIKVNRDNGGNFEVFVDTSQAQTQYFSLGLVNDFTYTSSAYFGFNCKYTATRSDKFWLDDVVITTQPYVDNDPPVLQNLQVLNLRTIQLSFNEQLDSLHATDINNYSLNNNVIHTVTNGQQLTLYLNSELANNEWYTLNAQVMDVANNTLDTVAVFKLEDNVGLGALLINEVYPDETPSYGMPNGEFVELFNPGSDTIFMKGWKIADLTDTVLLPSDTLLPQSYLVLCKTSTVGAFSLYGPSLGVPNFLSLNNSFESLLLLNPYDKVVDSLRYNNSWYRNLKDAAGNEKQSGGYSLERLAPTASCSNFYNWYPSTAILGGSPGTANSVVGISLPSAVLSVTGVYVENDTTLVLHFNEELPLIDVSNCSVLNNIIEQVYPPNKRQLYVLLQEPIAASSLQTFSFTNLQDCYGNAIADFSFSFYLFEEAAPQDLVFNELLFNPRIGGSDYIELYNQSEKAINLEGFTLVEYDVFNPSESTDSIVLENIIIPAKAYVVLSKDTDNILLNYVVENPENLYYHNIPNLNDDESIIALYLSNGALCDSVYYHKSWHLSLLDDLDGVALERIDVKQPSTAENNWHSAAKTYGYGTPTTKNSQNNNFVDPSDFFVSPEVFSPNEDGDRDFCQISFNNNAEASYGSLTIYNLEGVAIKVLAQKHSLGESNTWVWDGTNNNMELSDLGIYIVLLETFDEEGARKSYKNKMVLAMPLY